MDRSLAQKIVRLVAGERVGHKSRQFLPGIIDLGSWRQSLIAAMAAAGSQ
jgi:hypothetical protein